jgi:hypothetical protein
LEVCQGRGERKIRDTMTSLRASEVGKFDKAG